MKRKIYVLLFAGVLFGICMLARNGLIVSSIVAASGGIIGFILPNILLKRKMRKRRAMFELDMPDLLDHTAMLLSAGMNIWGAIDRASGMGNIQRPLYEELAVVRREVGAGVSGDMIAALERMSQRCSTGCVASFVSLVVQNARKGNSELIELFRMQAAIYRNERRNIAGRLAQEASTLLLLPSTIILVAIMAMLIAPAIIELIKM